MSGEQVYSRKQGIALALGGILLILGWAALLWWINEFAIYALVPYDDVWPKFRPLPGTWPRELNDFFERPPVRYVPGCLALGVSVVLFLAHSRTFKSPAARIRLAIGFALSNFLITLAMFANSGDILDFLPELPRSVYGRYGSAYRSILANTVLVGLWLSCQAWGIPKMLRGFSRKAPFH